MRLHQLQRTLWILLAAVLGYSVAAAQQPSLDEQTGIAQFGSYHGGDIDFIDLTNGHLMVNIPLVDYSQRGGKLKLGFVLHYVNLGTFFPGCLPNALAGGCTVWPFNQGFSFNRTGMPFATAGCSSEAIGSYTCRASVSSWDGATHPMVPVGPTTFRAIDGSGYRVDIPASKVPPAVVSLVPGDPSVTLTESDGTTHTWGPIGSPTVSEDSNGNQIVTGPNGIVDTLGRVIPGQPVTPIGLPGPFPVGLGGYTPDYSGCTGPLPTAGASFWNPPGPNGGAYPVKLCFASIDEINPGGGWTAGGYSWPVAAEPTTSIQLQSVVLPNGSAWTFEYTTDGMGDLARITFPTGGTLAYTWTTPANPVTVTVMTGNEGIIPRAVATRTLDPQDGVSPAGTWTYNYNRIVPNGLPQQVITTVTDPLGNDVVHTFDFLKTGAPNSVYETLTQYYQGLHSTGALLRTEKREYEGASAWVGPISAVGGVFPIRLTTTLENGLVTKTETDYDSGFSNILSGLIANDGTPIPPTCPLATSDYPCPGSGFFGKVVATRDYDFGMGAPGPLMKTESTPHLALTNAAYLNFNQLDLLSSQVITDGTGNVVSSSILGYDETSPLASGITTQHDSAPHAGALRGNMTSIQQLVAEPSNSCNNFTPASSYITSSRRWFDTGQLAQGIDPLGHTTSYSYSPNFDGAYATSICDALNHCTDADYDFNTGLVTSTTDSNQQRTSFKYDVMHRIVEIDYPPQVVGGTAINDTTLLSYNDTPGSLSVQRTRTQDAGSSLVDLHFFDGLGRPSKTQLNDPEGNVLTQTTYDPLGRVIAITNPFRTPTDSTYGTTRTQYDALGRVTQVTHPDNSTVIKSYSGRAVKVLDEGNGTSRLTRISQSDAADRLISVCEVTAASQANGHQPVACGQDIAGTGYLTTYQYDVLDHLIRASQGSTSRTFVFDSASRLLSTTNPESGTTCNRYDGDSNLRQRTRPAPNQSNPNVTVATNYSYDGVNRLTNVTYSDSVTSNLVKRYDTSSELGVALENTVGRLTAEYVYTPAGQLTSGKIYSYDALGRVIDNSQCTPQNCAGTPFRIHYSYDTLGKTLTADNGVGTTFTYAYDGAGRLATMTSSLSDSNHPGTIFSGASYDPFGHLSAASVGTAFSESFIFNNRGWITSYSSAVIQPTSSLLNNTDINSILQLTRPRGVRRSTLSGEFLRDRAWLPSATHSRSILITPAGGTARNPEPVELTLTTLDVQQNPTVFRFTSRGRGKATGIALDLARQVNRARLPVKAQVRQYGSSAVLDLAYKNGVRQTRLYAFIARASKHAVSPMTTMAAARGAPTQPAF